MAWFLPFLAKTAISTVASAALGNYQRKQALKDQANSMVRMRDAASRAGFNPLTALRAGALSGYQQSLPPGGAAFAAQYLGDAIGEAFDKKANEPIEKYNAEIRKLELEQRKADLSISRATLGQLNAPKAQLNIPPAGQKIGAAGSPITTTVLNNSGAVIAQETLDMLGVRQDAQGKYVSDRGEAVMKTFVGESGRVYRLPSSGLEWDDVLLSGLLHVNDLGWQAWDYAKENVPKLSRKVMQYVQ